MYRMHHSSRAGETVLSLLTSLSLTRNMNVKVPIELYYIFPKHRNLNTGNFSLTLSKYCLSKLSANYPELTKFLTGGFVTFTRRYVGLIMYRKTCVQRPLLKRPKISFQDRYRQKYCRMLHGEHSAILSTFIKVPFVIKTFVLSSFTQVLLYSAWFELLNIYGRFKV